MQNRKYSILVTLIINFALILITQAFTTNPLPMPQKSSSFLGPRGGGNKSRARPATPTSSILKETAAATASIENLPDIVVDEEEDGELKKTIFAAMVAPPNTRGSSSMQSMFSSIDAVTCIAYLCNILALSLPILLVPMAATEQAAMLGVNPTTFVAAKVASISSVASIGGALGKFINGFVCKEVGTYDCSKYYLFGLSIFSLLFSFSTNPISLGVGFAGMEFFSSIQCAALSVMLSDYYKGSAKQLAAALTALGLAATIGEVFSKVLGTALLSHFHWRQVAQFGSLVAIVGAAVISQAPGRQEARQLQAAKEPFRWSSVTDSLQAILGSGLFWKLAAAYSMGFVACTSDRILSPFYSSVSGLPLNICGGLTLSVILGVLHGLITGSKHTERMVSTEESLLFFKNRYIKSTVATLALAGLTYLGPGAIPNGAIMATLVAFLTATMASNVAYQYYHFPAMIAKKFPDHQAVCISFLDGFGYLLSVPLFASLGVIIPKWGWASGWGMLTVLFAAGGVVMMKSIPNILELHADEKDK